MREPRGTIVVNRELVDWVREGEPKVDGSDVPWVPGRPAIVDDGFEADAAV